MKYIVNQKTNSIISLFGGKIKPVRTDIHPGGEDQLKRYLFSDYTVLLLKKYFNFKQPHSIKYPKKETDEENSFCY